MSVTAEQLHIASMIDTEVNRIVDAGGDDMTLLQEMTDYTEEIFAETLEKVYSRKVLLSYLLTSLVIHDRRFAFTSELCLGRTSPLATEQRLDQETGDNVPLSLDDAHSERDY